MREIITVACLSVYLLAFSASLSYARPQFSPSAYDLVNAVNALRSSKGMPLYELDPLLMLSAQGHADYLASIGLNVGNGHVGLGGTDADARALAVGYTYVPGLDIVEAWANANVHIQLDQIIYGFWADPDHMHVMLHWRGQHVGAGVTEKDGYVYYVLNVAAYWGDGGLTQQPTSSFAYSGAQQGEYPVSQYIAPVIVASP